jgi:acetyl esterase/lipase
MKLQISPFRPVLILALLALPAIAQEKPPVVPPSPALPSEPAPAGEAKAQPKRPAAPKPTEANVPYGEDPRQVLDFWKADTKDPAPLLFFIHGGGWNSGNKNSVANNGLKKYLDSGISVVSIHYRLVPAATAAGVKPPVSWPIHDAARALQFVRSKAEAWHLDKTRVAASGGSAGACTSLWLAFHDDLADPASRDPIARESTRLTCAAVIRAQTSLDPAQMKEWTPNSRYGGHAFGFAADPQTKKSQFAAFLEGRESVMPWIKEYSPFELVTKDDPPIFMIYSTPPAMGQEEKDPTHTANFGVKLDEKLKATGVESVLQFPGAKVKPDTVEEFVISKLKPEAK